MIDAQSETFPFLFDSRFRPLLAVAGITPATASVTITAHRLVARFGRWVCDTPLSNIAGIRHTGPYRWYKAIGVRGSFVDRGLTFGSSTQGGVCVCFHEPVTGLEPFGFVHHPGLTMTVDRPDSFAATLAARVAAAATEPFRY